MNGHGDVSPVSPELLGDDGAFSTLEVSPEQKAREYTALRYGGLEPTIQSDGKEVRYSEVGKQVLYSEVGKQVVPDDGKEKVVGFGLSAEPEKLEGNQRKTIFSLPRWGFWLMLVVLATVITTIAVRAGAGISIHNKERHDAAVAASKESSSLAAAHSSSSSIAPIPTSTTNDTLVSMKSPINSVQMSITACGDCFFIHGVGSHVWWSSILTTYVSTLAISVDPSGRTLATSFVENSVANSYTGVSFSQNITQYVNISNFGFAATATSSQNWVGCSVINQTTDKTYIFPSFSLSIPFHY